MSQDILVGSFSTHLQVLHFDVNRGTLELSQVSEPAFDKYTWIAASPKLPGVFYGAGRTPSDGVLTAFKISAAQDSTSDRYKVQILSNCSSGGQDPAHIGVRNDGARVGIANYDSGTVQVSQVNPSDGSINAEANQVFDFKQHLAKIGPVTDRQDMPHPHGCFYTTSGQLLVPDLACDQVAISEAPHHTLEAHGKQLKCRPGSGPRHLALHPNKKHAYVLGELDNTVTVHDLTNVSTEPNALPSVSVLPDGCNSSNDASSTVKGPGMCASAILLTPDAHHLYITNRLDTHEAGDAITWLQVSEDGTSLQRGGSIRTGLKNLRGAEIFQVGGQNFVITGARGEKGAVVYQCDDNTGALKEVARNQEVDLPSCFVPMQI